ncbi:MAG: FecR domain-containing protein [Deltaproteobacteria bacterium]|nr:FecR domain-containing protein [Deltaproteobacteria bacterium]
MMRCGRWIFSGIFLSFLLLSVSIVPYAAAETCAQWTAKVVSAQGIVQVQRPGDSRPQPVKQNDTLCSGDTIRVLDKGRADLLLPNETLLRLDQNTAVRFHEPEKERSVLLDLLSGIAWFITRTPKSFKVNTPYMNAGVEGTEFCVSVVPGRTSVSCFEGTVAAVNAFGSVRLASGQTAVADEGKPPVLQIAARPRDAVRWTLYYPPIISIRPEAVPSGMEDWKLRVSRLLDVGRADEAGAEIEKALEKSPGDASALALQSVIAVAQNDKEKAHSLAGRAVESDPRSASARIALSYAKQSRFDLAGAVAAVDEALKLEPGNALAWARLAELRMSFGDLDGALAAANRAARLDPGLGRTQAVLGFALLARVETVASREAFGKAISLDQADPMPRLGMGLAMIRDGELSGGRREIEIAASLDPGNSLVRSYLGKAYYEEKRDRHASSQLELAKELDPSDPTPFFYDAIRKQTLNRPVEALRDLEKSISLNDNRAVYRSRLLLDEDLAARSASLGRIYGDLGFQQLALAEGWKSLQADPANHSAHRFLADSYSVLPRHEIARVSELLQSQLLQPINLTPLQPQLGQSDLRILSGAGPSRISFNEFNPLFLRNGYALQASGVGGSNHTLGDEIAFSAVSGKFSYSLGQFHYQTDGFRTNNDLRQNIYDVFAQWSISHKTAIQSEFQYTNVVQGDLTLNFDPASFLPDSRSESRTRSIRLGIRHELSPGSNMISSIFYRKSRFPSHLGVRFDDPFFPVDIVDELRTEQKDYSGEVQYLLRSERMNIVAGGGFVRLDSNSVDDMVMSSSGIILTSSSTSTENDISHSNLYLYSHLRYPRNVTWTLGASGDFLRDAKGTVADRNQFNPKFGVTWNALPGTTFRAAAFRVLRKNLPPTNQTIEPTHVAGFNQFYRDSQGTQSWRYGIGVDRKFSADIHGGVEYSRRDLIVRGFDPLAPTRPKDYDWKERLGRGYLYWTPDTWVAFGVEYLYEFVDRDPEFTAGIEHLSSHRVPLGVNFYHPGGFSFCIKETFFRQDGRFLAQGSFVGPGLSTAVPGSERFWLTDASASYRLPGRTGIVSIEGKNLFDRSFRYQDTDPFNPVIQPKRTVYFKFTLAL